MGYEINVNYLSQNRSYTALAPQGCVLHSTATPGATDENEDSFYNGGYRAASAHAFVDWDSITQTIPWDEKGWHAGTHANLMYDGVELCEPSGYDADKFNEVWKRAVWLFAYLFVNVYHFDTVTSDNLPCHKEISDRYPADTDHQDPVEYFATYGKTVDMFREAVQEEINAQLNGGSTIDETDSPAQETADPVEDYSGNLIVSANALNVRATPGENGEVIGQASNGTVLEGTGYIDGWYRVNFNGTVGYCSGMYLVKEEDTMSNDSQDTNPTQSSDPFNDWANVDDWAKDAVLKCKNLGLMNGSDGNFNPTDNLTREQAAVLVSNLLNYLGK